MNARNILIGSLTILMLLAAFSCSSPARPPVERISSVKSGDIYYADEKDTLPASMEITGKVIEQNIYGHCGIFAYDSVLKVQILQKIDGYSPQYAYLIVRCIELYDQDFNGKTVRIKATKLRTDQNQLVMMNSIESRGVPFYRADGIRVIPD